MTEAISAKLPVAGDQEPVQTEAVNAAGPEVESLTEERQGQPSSAEEPPSCSNSGPPPPGYMLVTVRLPNQSTPAVDNLPIEVLPCHTFADVCAAALARLPDAPRNVAMQAFLLLDGLEVPVQDPDTPARATLRSFPAARALRFDLLAPGGQGAPRCAKAVRVGSRKQRGPWPRRLARIAIGFAKLVLAVEAAALIRGGLTSLATQVARAAGWGGDSASYSGDESSEAGATSPRRVRGRGRGADPSSETEAEAALMAVAEYVSGRGDLEGLMRHDRRAVLRALEEANTEVLEQFDLPNVAQTRAAIKDLARDLRAGQEAQQPGSRSDVGAAAAAASSVLPAAGKGSNAAASASVAGAAGEVAGMPNGAGAREGPEPLPGFGPGAARGSA